MGIHLRNELLKQTSGKEKITELPLSEKDNWHIVVLADDEVVGTLMLSEMTHETARIEQVAISEKMQGYGLGFKVMYFAEKLACELGFKETYLTGRESAWLFYDKLGYESNSDITKGGTVNLKEFTKKLVAKNYLVKEMETNGRQ